MTSTTAAREHRPSPKVVKVALQIIDEDREQLLALAIVLEQRLGEMCNDGEDPPDEVATPITEWRLAQVLMRRLSEEDVGQRYVAPLLLGLVPDARHG